MIMMLPFLLAMAPASEPNDACRVIETESVLARDLAAMVPAFGQFPPDFLLGYVASSGVPRVFHAADLERIAKNRGVELHDLPEVCFVRKTFIPQPAQIRDAIAKALGVAGAKIDVIESSQHAVPSGELEFLRSGLQLPFGQGSQAEVMWRGSVRYGDNGRAPVWARVRITATMTRVVATADIATGKPIHAGQVRLETCEDSPLDETVARNLDEVVGYLAKITLRHSAVIHRSQVERPSDVARGDEVIVDVYEGLTHLRIEARAETAGMKGSIILVRNMASGKDFHAQVAGKGMAVIGSLPDAAAAPGGIQ